MMVWAGRTREWYALLLTDALVYIDSSTVQYSAPDCAGQLLLPWCYL